MKARPVHEVHRNRAGPLSRGVLAARAGVISIAAKLVLAASALVTIPIASSHLGAERFGLWMIISTFTALLAFSDLGIGNGVLNAIAYANGRNQPTTVRRVVATGTAVLSIASLAIFALFTLISYFADLGSAFGVSDPATLRELGVALVVFGACFALNVLGGLMQRTLNGLQRTASVGGLTILGACASVTTLLGVVYLNGSLPAMIAALVGTPACVMLLGSWITLKRSFPEYIPSLRETDRDVAKELIRNGLMFVCLQLCAALAYSTDLVIGARALGAANVGDFAIALKIYGTVSALAAAALSPLWPAHADAFARGDVPWLRTAFNRSLKYAVATSAAAVALLTLGFDSITQLWLGRRLALENVTLVGLASMTIVSTIGLPIAMLFNGIGYLRQQLVVAILFATTCVVLKLLLVPQYGLTALPWVTAISYTLIALVPYALLIPTIHPKSA